MRALGPSWGSASGREKHGPDRQDRWGVVGQPENAKGYFMILYMYFALSTAFQT